MTCRGTSRGEPILMSQTDQPVFVPSFPKSDRVRRSNNQACGENGTGAKISNQTVKGNHCEILLGARDEKTPFISSISSASGAIRLHPTIEVA